ncbi:GntR family transcriptional regulator [Natronosporangium hydrolyticum]|uniref:GntR family transcriptional regulator n=1 Tax=Natronosporangium hydrolyticum TaxID=2811111 RepID=A0A895YIR0_9ACTN|nr:GntR family transcriptional regulator [Natronosporangium hydrolyticum]QSB15885.1 GntR family transcriptional regulator [Natronosporangium hydrolyticum]
MPASLTEDTSGSALVDATASAIRTRIMSGEIPIGAQLRQAELAKLLGVSRTPVREALRQLQAGGLIEVVPHRGAVVRVPAPWEVREAYEVRAELEGLACERAVNRITAEVLDELREANILLRRTEHAAIATATRGANPGSDVGGQAHGDGLTSSTNAANDRFHTLIHQAAGSDWLARVIREINEAFPRNVSALVLDDNPRHRDDNFHEHERIIEALAADDGERARREMQAHVVSAGEQLARWYERRSQTVFRG